jgi:hypothetical protein
VCYHAPAVAAEIQSNLTNREAISPAADPAQPLESGPRPTANRPHES